MFDTGSGDFAGGAPHRAVPVATVPDDVPIDDLLSAPPSPGVAAALARLDLTVLDDVELARAIAAWDRVVSWAASQQARVVTELAHREPPRLAPDSYVADTIACELAVTRRSAQLLVDRAWGLADAPVLAEELDRGTLSVAKADALLKGTEHLPTDLAAQVHGQVLPDVRRRTVPQVKDAVRRAEQAIAPHQALRRHDRARAQRGVWLRPAPDAMAWVNAYLPATDAMQVMTAVDALATSCAADDDRPADARRADALTDLAATVLDRGTDLTGAPLPSQHGRRPHLHVTVTLAALCGTTDTPAELAGYGPVPAALARALATEARWTFLAVDPTTGQVVDRTATTYRPSPALTRAVLDRDVTCTFPGCRVPAPRCDIDHTTPFDPTRPADEQTMLSNLAALCRHHHRLKTHARWTPTRDPATGTTTWRTPTGATYTRDPAPVPFEQDPLPRPFRPPTKDAADHARPEESFHMQPGGSRDERADTHPDGSRNGDPDTHPDGSRVGHPKTRPESWHIGQPSAVRDRRPPPPPNRDAITDEPPPF
ncbi:HNH endonuclease signature motif containing protein [Cellulomonas carbonis]|uniref:HNH nuclease domain-containing protein n=1 Tax=Cellulomonas carbonis T26 TaxID=947969 RepID=A0A0A0BYU5_9CELL|nr:HNH endonuclease signature motif containing protein [Cellulomonas carbonis]KGM12314.1 hypothetical protein N868_18170 [Cellulomonas carbonis T26]GGC01508.1 hypothetical protein GCM10010972_12850 [Cellulomonas carbonis]